MYTYTTLRPAIAMIELIFALVVMGIVLTSAPLLISQASKSNTVALQQESIAIAAAHTNTLMTYAWDEQNNRSNALEKIIDTNTGDPLLGRITTASLYRNTSLQFPNARKRQFSGSILPASPLGIDTNSTSSSISDDVDDFIVQVVELIPQSTTQNKAYEGEYIDTKIKISTAVSYGTDTTPNYDNASGIFAFSNPASLGIGTSNIKLITTQLTTTQTAEELQKKIKMQAFMCNIGGARPIPKGGY